MSETSKQPLNKMCCNKNNTHDIINTEHEHVF